MQQGASRVRYRTRIPLVGVNGRPAKRKRAVDDYNQSVFRKFSHFIKKGMIRIKPERRLGAPWMDNFVALRKNVRICLECKTRWEGWQNRYGYRFARQATGDCMGCNSAIVQSVYSYVPEELYSTFINR